jgi:hypothetical protein
MPKEKPSLVAQEAEYDRQNAEIARQFLADPLKYAGIRLEWARLFMERYRAKRERTRTTLFEMEMEEVA